MSDWCDFTELKITLRAMSNNTSLNVLHQLAGKREVTVTELVCALAISQPLVSWHLRNLRRVGLVRTRRRGREVYCSLDTDQFATWQRALAELVFAADAGEAPSPASAAAAGAEPPHGASAGVRSPPKENADGHPRPRAGPDAP